MAHTSNDHTGLVSPRSVSRSVSGASASTSYVAGNPNSSRTLSPPLNKQGQALNVHSGTGGAQPDLRVSVPNYSSHTQGNAGNQSHGTQWPGHNIQQQHMSAYTPSHLGDGVGGSTRNSWDLNSYLQSSPAISTPGLDRSQSINFNRGGSMSSNSRLSDIPANLSNYAREAETQSKRLGDRAS
jgi:hypothetical protein